MKYFTLSAIILALIVVTVTETDCSSGGTSKRYVFTPPDGIYDLGDIGADDAGAGNGSITIEKPIDSYYFNLTAQAHLILYAWASPGSSLNPMLRLFNENDTMLQYNTASADGENPYLTRSLTAGTYRLEIYPEGGTTGEYDFILLTQPGDFRIELGEFANPGNASDTADTASCPTAEKIWYYTIALDVPLTVTLDVTQTNIDGYISVYDVKTGNTVGEARQTVVLTSQAAGLYLVGVGDETGAKTGSYDLTVTVTP